MRRVTVTLAIGVGLGSCTSGSDMPVGPVVTGFLIPTATAVTTPEPTADVCAAGPDILGRWPLPSVGSLSWIDIDREGGGRVLALEGLAAPASVEEASPDGRWLVVRLLESCEYVDDRYECRHRVYVMDTRGEEHWIPDPNPAGAEADDYRYNKYAWLDDNRLLWIGDGRVFLAEPGGAGVRELPGPAEATQLWLGRDNVALVATDDGLWRLFADSGVWERVRGMERIPGLQYSYGVSVSGGNVGLAPDGSFAAVESGGGYLWRVPLSTGGTARYITQVEHVGRGAPPPPPEPLAGSPMWISPGDLHELPGSGYALVDSRDGDVVPIGEALGMPSDYVSPYGSIVHGNWVVASVSLEGTDEVSGLPRSAVYVAPSGNLTAGQLLEGFNWLGSLDEPPTLFLRKFGAESSSLWQLDLETGDTTMILDGLPVRGHAWLEALPGEYVFHLFPAGIGFDDSPVELRSYAGALLGSLDLPLGTDHFWWTVTASNRLILDITRHKVGEEGECEFELDENLLQWDLSNVGPP